MCSLVAWDVRSCSFPLAGFLSITTEALFVASAIRVYDTIMNRERDTHYAPSTVDIAATSKKCSFPGVITIQPDVGTNMECWRFYEMFNSLCGLSDVSVGGSATGLFSGRDDNLVKVILYPALRCSRPACTGYLFIR